MVQFTLFQKPIETFESGEERIVEASFEYQTKKIRFNVGYKHALTSFEKIKTYLVEEKSDRCRKGLVCNNFGKCYSCPPGSPSIDKYNREGYKNVLVYAFWVYWGFTMKEKDPIKYKKQNAYLKLENANRTISPMTFNYGRKLEKLLGGKDMIDGRCPLCIKCNYPNGCLHPKEMRCSMESLGLDACKISKDILQHEIQWYIRRDNSDVLITPKYLTAIHCLLTNSNEPKEMLK